MLLLFIKGCVLPLKTSPSSCLVHKPFTFHSYLHLYGSFLLTSLETLQSKGTFSFILFLLCLVCIKEATDCEVGFINGSWSVLTSMQLYFVGRIWLDRRIHSSEEFRLLHFTRKTSF